VRPIATLARDGVVVIAEIGCNHNGDLTLAERLVEAAARAGADAAKFQSFVPSEMIVRAAPKARYQLAQTDPGESQYARLERLRLTPEAHERLLCCCQANGIAFCSSPFDAPSADLLERLGVPFFKIPSGELTNLPLLRRVASFGRPMVISTGMSTLGEIEEALDALGPAATACAVLLHCVSDYPADWKTMNLRAMQTMAAAFGRPVGFSDHSEGIELPLVAIAMGAVVIEKHLTLDRTMEGGDHKASLEPDDFTRMVNRIRALEEALGDGVKRCHAAEANVRLVARKSLVARTPIAQGQRIDAGMLAVKRPGTGIPPKHLDDVVGRCAREPIEADQVIQWSDLL